MQITLKAAELQTINGGVNDIMSKLFKKFLAANPDIADVLGDIENPEDYYHFLP